LNFILFRLRNYEWTPQRDQTQLFKRKPEPTINRILRKLCSKQTTLVYVSTKLEDYEKERGEFLVTGLFLAPSSIPKHMDGSFNFGHSEESSDESEVEVHDQVNEEEAVDKSVTSRMLVEMRDCETKVVEQNEAKEKTEAMKDHLQEKKAKLDADWRDAHKQLANMEDLEKKQKDENLGPEEVKMLARKDAMTARKVGLQSSILVAKKELAAAKLADLEAGRAATAAEARLKEVRTFCKKFIDYKALSLAGSEVDDGLARVSTPRTTPGMRPSSGGIPTPDLTMGVSTGSVSGPDTPTATTKKGVYIPSFVVNNKAFRKPEFIMKDLVDMVRFPACMEVSGVRNIIIFMV